MDTLIKELVSWIQQTAPIVWEAAYRQVYVQAIHDVGWIVVFAILGVIAYGIARLTLRVVKDRKAYREEHRKDYGDEPWDLDTFLGAVLGFGTAIFCVLSIIVNVFWIIGYLINPTYYAIQQLINMFPSK